MLNIDMNTWNNTKADDGYKRLTPGGHRCVIKNVENRQSKAGKPMLAIAFDIAGGEFDGYFMDLYGKNVTDAAKDGKQAKWPNGGVYYQLIDEEHLGRFKAVINSIEASNPGFKFDMNEKSLIGKLFGGVFREEEYLSNRDGSIKTSLKCNAIRKIDGIEDIPVPAKKCLAGSPSQGNSPVVEEEIPF
jgi:hypothetical protein